MLTIWKNERGLTLIELMAAVVILVLVAIPLSSIGTTVYRWYKEDQQKNEAVLFAEQTVQDQKKVLENTGYTFDEPQHVITIEDADANGLQAVVTLTPHLFEGATLPTDSLIDVEVEVKGPDLANIGGDLISLTHLETTIRQKSAGGTP
ncbi:prepilin-type N-terminal cleavage/methylation domain-containing protein [Tumebacillus sp. ITR2]|uniref:Prepilin-type N-terminal cleavage/methylation domain-containing protein n=1 Tax=Tumebacillus amylolyticus TaxID=2801339 RepID=A0ABS1J9W9_9BACL|nr:prepilin-type N-terminal cleavage/methylation domain-containing protein [Tumebacillus amylolyticus]MBL0387068.1 prepilin-type N-terminal cleavage/methylation domain-containing protein [Tumebacillus amylolyticus]